MLLFRPFRSGGQWAHAASAAAALGVMCAYGQPGIELALLTPLGLILFAFLAARARSFGAAASIGIAFGIGFFAVVTIAARTWAYSVPVALTLAGAGLFGLPQALWTYGIARRQYGRAAFCATIAAWTLCLELSERLGLPTKIEALWAISCAPALMGGARWVGCNVLGGVLAAGFIGCGSRLATLRKFELRSAGLAVLPLVASGLLLLMASGLAHLTAADSSPKIRVGVPQMNVPSAYTGERIASTELAEAFEEVFARQVAELGEVDLLALTETYDDAFPLQVPRSLRRFENHAKLQHQAVLLSSYLVSADGGLLNTVGGIDREGVLVGVHRKVDLAPFGEVEYEHGSGFHPLPLLPGVRVGVLICQESFLRDGASALVKAGANLLVSPTSDISFGSGEIVFEHLAGARLHAVETGRSMVWASAGGPSGAIDRWGTFQPAAPFRAPGAAAFTVEVHDDSTLFVRSESLWPGLAATALAALAIYLTRRAPTPEVSRPRVGSWRAALEFVLVGPFVVAASIGSVGAVEIRNGDQERARRSIRELIHGPQRVLDGRGSLRRFQAAPPRTAQAAAAYYLTFYGQRAPSAAVFEELPQSLSELAVALDRSAEFPTREVAIDFASPQRAAMLVQQKSGDFAVMRSDRAKRVWFFSPISADVEELTAQQAASLLRPAGLLPALNSTLGDD